MYLHLTLLESRHRSFMLTCTFLHISKVTVLLPCRTLISFVTISKFNSAFLWLIKSLRLEFSFKSALPLYWFLHLLMSLINFHTCPCCTKFMLSTFWKPYLTTVITLLTQSLLCSYCFLRKKCFLPWPGHFYTFKRQHFFFLMYTNLTLFYTFTGHNYLQSYLVWPLLF